MFAKKRLDYLVIPDARKSLKKERKKRAIEEMHQRPIDKILILKGKDSEEDVLYLGKIVKRGDVVGIDTFPLHFKEYKEIINRAKKQRKFPKGVYIEHVYTTQRPKLLIYGLLGWLEEKLNGNVNFKKNRKKNFADKIKSFVKRILTD